MHEYAATGMRDEADEIEALRIKNGAWKLPGWCWWTDGCRNIHPFTVGDEQDGSCGHMEKLAIAFALTNTPEGTPIHITKNMRVCNDCHFAASLISKMEKRKIHVKDANCIHVFEDGKCLCKKCG